VVASYGAEQGGGGPADRLDERRGIVRLDYELGRAAEVRGVVGCDQGRVKRGFSFLCAAGEVGLGQGERRVRGWFHGVSRSVSVLRRWPDAFSTRRVSVVAPCRSAYAAPSTPSTRACASPPRPDLSRHPSRRLTDPRGRSSAPADSSPTSPLSQACARRASLIAPWPCLRRPQARSSSRRSERLRCARPAAIPAPPSRSSGPATTSA
jgi:hypothetical protein